MTQPVSQTPYKPNLSHAISTLAAAITANQPAREFNKIHIDEDCTEMSGLHHNELFYNCKFKNLNDLILSNCDLSNSTFLTDAITDCMNFTLTLNCHSVRNVECSELLFDLLLALLSKTKGNDEKRKKLLEVVGEDRAAHILKYIERLER